MVNFLSLVFWEIFTLQQRRFSTSDKTPKLGIKITVQQMLATADAGGIDKFRSCEELKHLFN